MAARTKPIRRAFQNVGFRLPEYIKAAMRVFFLLLLLPLRRRRRRRSTAVASTAAPSRVFCVLSVFMDAILVVNAAGDLVPANLVGPNGVNVVNPAALFLNGPVLGADDGLDEWKLVRSRKLGMERGANRAQEEPPVDEVPVCELEFEWLPKTGPRRFIKQWSQLRKGGYVGTKEGQAVLVYRSYPPESA